MITKTQIKNLAEVFQIDEYTVFREYLQLLFLSCLYQEKGSAGIIFKGGTALRLIFGSPRFSEDLDFSTLSSDKEIREILSKIEISLARELPGLKITQIYSGKEGIRFRISYKSDDFKYPLNVRLDFHRVTKLPEKQFSAMSTRFPLMIFPQILHLTEAAIFQEKLAALSVRSKGRDVFDIWYLLQKGVEPFSADGKKEIAKKLKSFSQESLNKDLGKFLPRGQKAIIPGLKEEIIKLL